MPLEWLGALTSCQHSSPSKNNTHNSRLRNNRRSLPRWTTAEQLLPLLSGWWLYTQHGVTMATLLRLSEDNITLRVSFDLIQLRWHASECLNLAHKRISSALYSKCHWLTTSVSSARTRLAKSVTSTLAPETGDCFLQRSRVPWTQHYTMSMNMIFLPVSEKASGPLATVVILVLDVDDTTQNKWQILN